MIDHSKQAYLKSIKKILLNETASLEVDLFGGAITNFHLHEGKVNPLSFKFSKEQMPANNQPGAPYQGHFLCLGRWGEPSAGEIKAGIPDHGQIANIDWEALQSDDKKLTMQTTGQLEGLHVERTIQLESGLPVYLVHEQVKNINPLGRLYNMVQHPTLAAPFLDNHTIVNCNASAGFNYHFFNSPESHTIHWPRVIGENGSIIDLSKSVNGNNSVYSFIVSRETDLGWVTAYAPKAGLLFGYLWRRKDYPWINLWQDWSDGQIRFRGLEFGTTGIHRPFQQILENGKSRVFGENTFAYIDAGETVSRSYLSFLHRVEPDFAGVDAISLLNGFITIKTCANERKYINTSFKNF